MESEEILEEVENQKDNTWSETSSSIRKNVSMSMVEFCYAGVGSRSTPVVVLEKMSEVAMWLAVLGWKVRSGGAPGADKAFEDGCDLSGGDKEIYLPFKLFNGNQSLLYPPTPAAIQLASTIHPVWSACNHVARLLHGRNSHQALGQHLDTPVKMVLCWTQDGKASGGSATCMKLSERHGAVIFNFFHGDIWWDDFIRLAHTIKG